MLLRPRQEQFVTRALDALQEHGNTLGVAPTGAGKTVMSAAVALKMAKPHEGVLFLQHRDELVAQNRATFKRLADDTAIRTSVIDGKIRDGHGDVIFAMVQSLVGNLRLLPRIGLVITDETHHSAAKTYKKIYDFVREKNERTKFFGVTATPERADKKALTGIYNNVCDVIALGELIRAGNLVPPRALVVDLGVQEDLRRVKRTAADFDMAEVEAIMDKEVHHDAVISAWREHAGDRQTVAFCSTVKHSEHFVAACHTAGIAAEHIDGEMPARARRDVLERFDRREFQILSNVMVLTEGWDNQPTSCVILLRPSSSAGTMVQMVGRGLRKLDPERYPGVRKSDCIILDFGTSLLTHGSLDVGTSLDPVKGAGKKKTCPECFSQIPAGLRVCPLCSHEFLPPVAGDKEESDRERLDNIVLTEIDILNASPFRWEAIFNGTVMVATSFSAWAMAIFYGGDWYAVGGNSESGVHILEAGIASNLQALSTADDFMRTYGKPSDAGKAKRWLLEAATEKQAAALRMSPMQAQAMGLTKYQAACHLTWKSNERAVRAKVLAAAAAR